MARGERSREITNKFCDGETEKNRALFAHFDSVLTVFFISSLSASDIYSKIGLVSHFRFG